MRTEKIIPRHPYQFLILFKNKEAFYTNYFDVENHFSEDMVVFDLHNHVFMNDGKNWEPIEEDHL